MNLKIYTLLAACCLLLAGCGLFATAQDYVAPQVDVSAEKVKLDGKTYYSHQVQEKQTLYSIAKTYGVTVAEIEAVNPTLKQKGLQAGSHLLIPIKEESAKKKGWSLFSDRQDNTATTAADIQPVENPYIQPQPGQDYVEHKVKWYEDLNSIAAAYGVSAADIMKFNGLDSPKLKSRMVLKIPKGTILNNPADNTAQKDEKPAPADTVTGTGTGTEETSTEVDNSFLFPRKDIVDLALLLPFNTKGKVSGANMDFYAGVLMAVRDLKEEGIATTLSVYDISGSGALPEQEVFKKFDAVLGPVSEQDLSTAIGVSGGDVPFISPLDQNALPLADDNRNFIQVPTPVYRQYEELADWVAQDRSNDDRIILISQKGGKDSLLVEQMDKALSRQYFHYTSVECTSYEARTIQTRLTPLMNDKTENRILLVSENQSFLSEVTRNLGQLVGKGYPVTVYAPSKVRTFELDGNTLHQIRLHIASPYFVDYGDPAVQRFILQFRALYNAEPTQFAFHGYDTARYFIGLISGNGRRWMRRVDQPRAHGLHTDFDFKRLSGGGYVNAAVRRIVYRDDYTTRLEK